MAMAFLACCRCPHPRGQTLHPWDTAAANQSVLLIRSWRRLDVDDLDLLAVLHAPRARLLVVRARVPSAERLTIHEPHALTDAQPVVVTAELDVSVDARGDAGAGARVVIPLPLIAQQLSRLCAWQGAP